MIETSEPAEIRILGIDCAVDPRRVGLASAIYRGGRLEETEVLAPRDGRQMAEWLADRARGMTSLLAVDSPLGWPAPLAAALAGHRAGVPIPTGPDALFRRATDRFVREHAGKQPLEVGADRIARTAVAALRLLGEVADLLGGPIPLAWAPRRLAVVSAIETYPAAWLLSRGLPARAYKDASAEALARREAILTAIRPSLGTGEEALETLRASSHLLDACICLFCGVDFLCGRCSPPPDPELAAIEGWIWFSRSEPGP